MTELEIAKDIIKTYIEDAECGLFNTRNICGDYMDTIYQDATIKIDICYGYAYFEVFGLSRTDFNELKEYYSELVREIRNGNNEN